MSPVSILGVKAENHTFFEFNSILIIGISMKRGMQLHQMLLYNRLVQISQIYIELEIFFNISLKKGVIDHYIWYSK